MPIVISITKKNNLLKYILLILTIYSCTSNRLYELESKINNYVLGQNSSFEIKLDTISSFEWDELIVAGPYTDLQKIEDCELDKFPNSIKSHDRFIFLGFMLNKKGVKYIELKRDKGLDTLLNEGRNGYKIYLKKETNFKIQNNPSGARLQRVPF